MKYVPPINGDQSNADRPFIDGNPAQGIEGSIPPAASIEHPMREIVAAIVAAGLTPDAEDLTQLAQVIMSRAAANHTHIPASIGAAAASHTHLVTQITDLLSDQHQWQATQSMAGDVLHYATSIVWDMTTQQAVEVTLTGDALLANPVALPAGRTQFSALFRQDETGGHTLSYDSAWLPPVTGGKMPEIATDPLAVTLLVIESDGTNLYVCGGV